MLSQVLAMHEHWSPQLVMGASDGVFGVLVTVCRIGGLAPKVRGSANSMDERREAVASLLEIHETHLVHEELRSREQLNICFSASIR